VPEPTRNDVRALHYTPTDPPIFEPRQRARIDFPAKYHVVTIRVLITGYRLRWISGTMSM